MLELDLGVKGGPSKSLMWLRNHFMNDMSDCRICELFVTSAVSRPSK